MTTVDRSLRTAALGLLLVSALQGCTVTGAGYDDTVGVSYGLGFYEPMGYDYGGWGPGYRVGPPRGDDRRRQSSSRPFRSPHPSRATPSIPTRSRIQR